MFIVPLKKRRLTSPIGSAKSVAASHITDWFGTM
jgi:hypothetical protein